MQSCEDNPNYDPLDPRDTSEPEDMQEAIHECQQYALAELEEESDLEQARRRAPMPDYPDDINFDQMCYSDLPPKTQRRF